MMELKNAVKTASAVALSLSFACPASAAKKILTEEELEELLVGNTMQITSKGDSWAQYLDDNGALRGLWKGQKDNGTYRITVDGLLCRIWESWSKGEACWQITQTRKNKFTTKLKKGSSSTNKSTFKILVGNPNNL